VFILQLTTACIAESWWCCTAIINVQWRISGGSAVWPDARRAADSTASTAEFQRRSVSGWCSSEQIQIAFEN